MVGFGIPFVWLQGIEVGEDDLGSSFLASITRSAIQLGAGGTIIAGLVEHAILKKARIKAEKDGVDFQEKLKEAGCGTKKGTVKPTTQPNKGRRKMTS